MFLHYLPYGIIYSVKILDCKSVTKCDVEYTVL